jgi:hypothetical protein
VGLTATAGSQEERELAPAGLHLAICYGVYDLGTQRTSYMGQPKVARKVLLMWELCEEKMKDGRPFGVSKTYTLSLWEKANLRKDLKNWRGRDFTEEELKSFDVANIIGKACMVQVEHVSKGEKTYANVATVASKPKGMQEPLMVNVKRYFSFEDGHGIPDGTPEWVSKKIMESDEWKARQNQHQDGIPQTGGQEW